MRNHTPAHALLTLFGVIVVLLAVILLAVSAPAAVARSAQSNLVTWTGKGNDARWSNPANWDAGHVPGPTDIARFAASSAIALVDTRFDGTVAGLQLDAGFKGLVRLERRLEIMGDLALHGGMLDGSSGELWIKGAARVTGGVLMTPHTSLWANSMDIQAPGLVRLSVNGRLTLAGDGTPLTGNGLLDTTTHRPNTVEYTGHSTTSLSGAGPLVTMRALNLSKNSIQQLLAAATPNAPDLTANYLSTLGNNLAAALIDKANGFAYFGSNANPAVIVKVDLATFSEVGVVSLADDGQIAAGVIDTTNGFAYFGGSNNISGDGSIVKVNVSPGGFAYSNTLSLGTTGIFLGSAVIDPANGLAYFGGFLNLTQGGIFKIGLTTTVPSLIDTVPLLAGEDIPTSAVIDTVNHAAYFGVLDFFTTPGNISVVKIALSPVFARTAATPLTGLTNADSAVIDQSAGFAYFGTTRFDGVSALPPVNIVKVQLSPISTTAPISVAAIRPFSTITWTLDQVKAATIDTAGGFAYFAGSHSLVGSPTVVAKVSLSTFTPVDWLPLATIGENAVSAVIDPGRKAYLGMDSNRVAQVLLSNSQLGVTSSANPSVFGQSVTFTATVSAVSGVPGRPTGTVTFTIDSSTSVTRSLSAAGTSTSTATLVTSTLAVAVAPHTILVTYGGDGTFTPTSDSLNQTVNKADTSTGLAASTNPSVYGQPITLTATVTATTPGAGTPSGVVTFTLDGTLNVTATLNASRVGTYVTSTLSVATHPITATYGGDGSFKTSTSSTLNQVINKANTTTSLTTSATPTVFGQPITLTAIVTATSPGAGTPTGVVTFTFDGATPVTAALNASRVATYVTSTLAVATHPIVATYAGDTSFGASSSSTVNQVVNKASTTTGLTASPTPSVFGQSVTFTATVSVGAPGAGTPSGSVMFFDGASNIGSGSVGAGGIVTLSTSALSVGAHAAITAQYGGDGSFNSSTSTAYAQTVNKASTATSVTSAPNPSVFGQSVTFTATVSVSAPGVGAPSGTVTFFDGVTNIGTGAVSGSGSAMIVISPLSVGAHAAITAQYGGDTNFNGSTSGAYLHTVNKADTTASVTTAPNPSVFGQSVTFTAIVTATAPGAGTPTGTVTFTFDGGTNVAATFNASRVATYVTSTLSVAGHSVSATYGGDGSFNTSSASLPTQTVNKANTTTSVASSVNPSIFGQSVTFTATVATVSPGAGNPAGTVTFTIDAATTNVPLVNGVATFSTAALTVGAHTVSAAYSGDANFNTSTGLLPTQTVNKASTTTTVTSSPNASLFGQSVTFTATFAAVLPGVGTPTGIVTFTIDGTLVAVASSGGVATYSTSSLSAGSHTISAAYGGDGSFNSSSGSLPTQTVNKTSTTTSLTSAPNASVFGQSVTFTATVAVVAPGSGSPSGLVTFLDNGSSIGSGTVAGSIAIFTTSALAVGTHANITAQYVGDASFNGSTSSAYSQTVNKASTAIALTSSAPSPSVYLETVTFTFTLSVTSPGNGTPTGVVTITDGTQSCTAALPSTSCAITFNSVGAKSLTATYSGDGSFNSATSSAFAHTVTARPPVAIDDSYTILENGVLTVAATGVLSNDVALNGRPITSTLLNSPITGTLTFNTNGSFTFTPTQYFNGVVTYTYQANDAGLVSNAAIVTVTVLSVNQPPSFMPGPDISVFTSTQFITNSWATNISVGPANESAQTVAFTVTTNNPNLFQIPPTLSPTGTLSFKPAPFYAGTAVATVFAQDNGGTANGGVDTSPSITFTIVISSDPDVPINFVPGPQTTYINQAHVFSSGGGNGISVFDPDAAALSEVLSVTLRATNGTLQLGSLAGLIVTPTTGVGSVVSLSGLITPTNAALNGLTFTPTLNFVGAAGVVIETQDMGHFGEPASFTVADAVDIAVIDTPITSVNAVNSSPTALGSTTFFTASQTGGTNVAYVWDFGDGITTTGQTASHGYGAIGSYTAIVTALNPTNQLTATTPVTIVDAAIVSVAASNNSPTVFGSSTQFTATQTGGTNVNYAWDFGESTTGSGANPAHLYAAVGNYTATVVVTNGVSNKSATTPVTIIKATPIVAISTHLPNPSVVGQIVIVTWSVTPPGAGAATGTITVTDSAQTCVASAAAGQCTIAFASPGTKTLTAQYSGNVNFNAATSGSVLHTVNKASTTTSLSATSPALFGQVWPITVSVVASAPGNGTPGGAVNVTDGSVSCNVTLPATSCNLTFSLLGTHTLTATYSGDANFNTSNTTALLTVVDVPISNLSASNSSPTRLDDTTFFTATAAGTNIVYAWDFGDSSSIGSGANVTHTYALSGAYTAIVTATNSLGSQPTSTTAVTITNQRPVAVAFDAAFSINSTATLDGSFSTDPDGHYPLTYYWTQTGGSPTVSFTPNQSVTTFTAPSTPTVLTFTLTVTDAHDLPSLPKTVSITIANIPITGLAASNNSPTAFGVPTQLTATVSTGSSVIYTWSFGDGITTTGQFPVHTYDALGNYTALVTATNSLGVFTTTTSVAIIKATPLAAITSHAPDPAVVGQNVTIAFSVTPPGIFAPTGTVTVTDDTQSCTAAVATGSCSIAFTSPGAKSLTAQYSGDTNFNAASSVSVNHTVNQANTTTSVASTANPSVFGQSVIFTATVAVASPGSGTPTGLVAFTIDGVPVGTSTLSGGVAAYVTSTLAVATHPVVATYGGDTNFSGSSSGMLNQVVNKADTSISVASSANPSVFGQSVTFTATVAASGPGAGTPGGTVTFTIDGTPAAVALNGGVATVTMSSLSVGTRTVAVDYNGDGSFNTSSNTLPTQIVNVANSATSVVASQNPSIISQTVTFTATVTASAPGAGNPSGVVTFTIDGNVVATATLSGGTATYSTAVLAVGSHPVSVAYSGDGNFNTSSGGLTQVVNKPPSATSVTSTPDPSVFGQSVTFTATVTPVPGGPTPTGLVTFTIDGATAGSVSLSGGAASFSTAALSVGDHPVVVTYDGDVNFNGSASSTYTQTVNKADTATSVTSAPNPAVFGQSVTFTATIIVSAPGAGIPSGTVTFFDGATNLGTDAVGASGIVTLATSSLAVGVHDTITAQYAGDASFTSSTSGAATQTVNAANSTTTVGAVQNPAVFGQSVTFTATVAAVAPGAGSPAGTVTFTIDGANVVQPLSSGLATYVTSTLAVGSHSVGAAYGGDGNFAGSTANPINQVVNKANSAITIISSLNPAPVGQLITFAVTVAPVAPGAGTPTGVVTFTIDGAAVGAPALSGGVAIYSTSVLTGGLHTVSASYGGDASFNISAATLVPAQVVSQYRLFLPIVRQSGGRYRLFLPIVLR